MLIKITEHFLLQGMHVNKYIHLDYLDRELRYDVVVHCPGPVKCRGNIKLETETELVWNLNKSETNCTNRCFLAKDKLFHAVLQASKEGLYWLYNV